MLFMHSLGGLRNYDVYLPNLLHVLAVKKGTAPKKKPRQEAEKGQDLQCGDEIVPVGHHADE